MNQDLESRLERWKEWLNSEEGERQTKEFFENIEREEVLLENQMERFQKKVGNRFFEIVKKVEEKYESDKYKDRWYNRGVEPPEDLYWFLYKFAGKYGREATDEEYEKFGCTFTSSMYVYENCVFERIDGQGSAIRIHELNDSKNENNI